MGQIRRHCQRRRGQRSRHSHVRHHHGRPRVAGQDVDGRPPAEKILDHLRRHDLRIGAHAFGHHAMVGGEREDDGPVDRGREPSRDLGEPARQLLEPPETAQWLGQPIKGSLGLETRRGVREPDAAKELLEHGHPREFVARCL